MFLTVPQASLPLTGEHVHPQQVPTAHPLPWASRYPLSPPLLTLSPLLVRPSPTCSRCAQATWCSPQKSESTEKSARQNLWWKIPQTAGMVPMTEPPQKRASWKRRRVILVPARLRRVKRKYDLPQPRSDDIQWWKGLEPHSPGNSSRLGTLCSERSTLPATLITTYAIEMSAAMKIIKRIIIIKRRKIEVLR